MRSTKCICYTLFFWSAAAVWQMTQSQERAKDNGDIYVVNVARLIKPGSDELGSSETKATPTEATSATAATADNNNLIDFNATMTLCNASFSVPMDYIAEFNNTGELPNVIDKTGMCFVRCVYEKSGLLDNWQLNVNKIRANIWPATNDSIEACQQQDKNEANACVRTYAIARCLMLHALVDARNKPIV